DERGFSPVIHEISPRVIVVRPGEEFDLKINFTIRQFTHFPPGIIWQVFLLYSWAPTWPPPRGYYTPLYDGIPPYDGRNIARTIRVKAPETPGEYYIWVGVNHHYSMDLAISTAREKPPLPAHVKVIVRGASEENRNRATTQEVIHRPTGSLTLYIQNFEGMPLPPSGGVIEVTLYRGNAAMKRSLSYKGGEPEVSITIDGLELGASYCITVEHIPAAGLWPRETWHKSCFELPPSTPVYTLRINRTGPRILAVEYPEEVRPNTSFKVRVTVEDEKIQDRKAIIVVVFDRDDKPPFDAIINSTSPGTFSSSYPPHKNITYVIPATLTHRGNYTLYVAVMLNNTVIDQWASSQRLVVGDIIPISRCVRITDSGHYVLIGDIKGSSEPCIEIVASNVLLDGRGHTIEGPGKGEAILVEGVNVSIKNVKIKNYRIYVYGGAIWIGDSVMDSVGIKLDKSSGKIYNVSLVNSSISIHRSGGVTVKNSIFVNSKIFTSLAEYVWISENKFLNSLVFPEISRYINISENKFLNSEIYIRLSWDIQIVSNVIMNSTYCIYASNSYYLFVRNNVVSRCRTAMSLRNIWGAVEVVNNTISNSEIGISVEGGRDVKFINNQFIENMKNIGWWVHECVDNNVTAVNNTSARPITASPTPSPTTSAESVAQPISMPPSSHVRYVYVEILPASIVLNIVLIALLLRRRRGRSVGEETIMRTPTERRGLEVEIIEDKKERGDHTSR
ncbi:MAG: NosD domain-containing protein, partial [Pyrobaculum sp.]